jgi:hypothetical protein
MGIVAVDAGYYSFTAKIAMGAFRNKEGKQKKQNWEPFEKEEKIEDTQELKTHWGSVGTVYTSNTTWHAASTPVLAHALMLLAAFPYSS